MKAKTFTLEIPAPKVRNTFFKTGKKFTDKRSKKPRTEKGKGWEA